MLQMYFWRRYRDKGAHTDDLMHLSCLADAAPPHPIHACLRQQGQCVIQLNLTLLIGTLGTSSLCLTVHPVWTPDAMIP